MHVRHGRDAHPAFPFPARGPQAGQGKQTNRREADMAGQPRDRTVIGNISLSLDGRVTGPGGEYDMGWIVPHALTDESRSHLLKITSTASTVLLGRKNYQGFAGFWPPWPTTTTPTRGTGPSPGGSTRRKRSSSRARSPR